jgi:hypothetical protein
MSSMEAWEGRDPGGLHVLLANPRWEKRLLRFLELSGTGRLIPFHDWRQTFKESTIKSGFCKTGIVPLKPSMVLSQLQSDRSESEPSNQLPDPITPSPTGRPQSRCPKTTTHDCRNLKGQSEFLYQIAPQDNPEFSEVLDKFIRGSVLQSTEHARP